MPSSTPPTAGSGAEAAAPQQPLDASVSAEVELRLLRFLAALDRQLRATGEVSKALKVALRAAQTYFNAPSGCIAVISPGSRDCEQVICHPRRSQWDLALLAQFALRHKPAVPPDMMLARLNRREKPWGTLALRLAGRHATWADRTGLTRTAAVINEGIRHIERERLLEVRSRIDRKIMEQLRPQDLFYQILDGLRSLTRYDHSAALLISGEEGGHLEVVAEQVSWRKGKSQRVGLRLPISDALRLTLPDGMAWGFTRTGDRWKAWGNNSPVGLAELLDYNDAESRREEEMVCAALRTRDGHLAVIKVSARHAETFGPHETQLLAAFLPQASVALQNIHRTESLTAKMIESERKHAMADLARGVSHDVNNALGAVLPLVQQMRIDLAEGRSDPRTLADDLEQVERYVQLSRRIFGRMLAFARRASKPAGHGELRQAVSDAMEIMTEPFKRQGIQLSISIPGDLPPVTASHTDLEQLIINLASNARDAMPAGGTLSISASIQGDHVVLEVADTGCGIPPDHLSQVMEPFFTTKPQGNGLGLTICRSIVWQSQGRIHFQSPPGEGTRVCVHLPILSGHDR